MVRSPFFPGLARPLFGFAARGLHRTTPQDAQADPTEPDTESG